MAYTKEVADQIVERLADGETLKAICRTPGFPSETTVRRNWVMGDIEGFAKRYALARNLGVDAMVDSIIELANDSSHDVGKDGKPDYQNVHRARLKCDILRWYTGKMAPKKWGEPKAESIVVPGLLEAPTIEAKAQAVIAAVGSGQITAESGEKVLRMLDTLHRVVNLSDVERRLDALEQNKRPPQDIEDADVIIKQLQ